MTNNAPTSRLSSLRGWFTRRNIAITCGGLLFMCGGCLYLLPEPDLEPSQSRGFMSTIEATEADPPTAEPAVAPTGEPTEAATATPVATETDAPTETPEPTAAPTSTPEPTLPPPTATPAIPDLNPDQDRDCNEFSTREQAQAYWEHHRNPGRPNPGRLDGNNNGIVCEDPDRSAREVAPPPPPPAQSSGCVNFNSASYDDLRRITHVDDKIANQIISLRAQRPFSGWDDLVDRVSGIGKNNVKDIQAQGLGCF